MRSQLKPRLPYAFSYALSAVAIVFCLCSAPTMGLTQRLVVLDPGHGGPDPGAVGCNREESEHVLDVAVRTAPLLEELGLQVELTRTDDRAVELGARVAFANERQAALFISIHANANNGDAASGTETWIAENASATSLVLAENVQREMVAAWGLNDRGVRRRNFTVLAATTMPAILTEIGFINRCDNDSQRIGDPQQRQSMARAHAIGIAETLDAGPVGPDPVGTGELKGVVFEDIGAGVDDPSIRLPGANVKIIETGQTVNAEVETANWGFDVPPGTYTVQATLDGFESATRRCDVMANAVTWCSLGLTPSIMEPDMDVVTAGVSGAMMEPVMAGQPILPNPLNSGGVAMSGGLPAPSAPNMDISTGGRPAGIDDLLPPQPMPRPTTVGGADASTFGTANGRQQFSGSCSATATEGGTWLPFLLILLAAFRRHWYSLVGALCVVCGTAHAHVPETHPGGEVAVVGYDTAQRPHVHLVNTRVIAHGYHRAVLSPDGERVLLIGQKQKRLSILSLKPGASPRLLAQGRGIGRNPRWYPNGMGVAFPSSEQSSHAQPMLGVNLDGLREMPPLTRRKHVYTTHRDQVLINGTPVSPTGDRFFYLRIAPDEAHVVFWGLTTGVWLFRVKDRKLWSLGPGGHPSFDSHGDALVMDQTKERNGARIGADLFLVDLRIPEPVTVPLTSTPNRMEFSPSKAGRRVAFTDGAGTIWVGDLVNEDL